MAPNDFPMMGIDDLSAFQQAAAQNNFLSNLGPAINGAKFDMRYWSPGSQLAGSFGQAFLGAVLGQIGRAQVADEVAKVGAVLPDLYRNPSSVAAPEGVDESTFAPLRLRAQLKQLQQESYRQQLLNEMGLDLFKTAQSEQYKADAGAKAAGEAEKNKILAANQAWRQIAWAADGTGKDYVPTNPDDPRYKINMDLFKIEQAYTDKLLTGNEAQKALNMNKAARNIMEALKKDNPIAASTAIFEYAKLQDPMGTVREADEMRVADPGGPLGQLAQIYNTIQSKGKLTPEAKIAMREIVPILQDSTFLQYNQLKDSYLEAAQQYGANPERIKYIKPLNMADYLQSEDTTGTGATLSGSTNSGVLNQLQEIRNQLADTSLSAQDRKALVTRARGLALIQDSGG